MNAATRQPATAARAATPPAGRVRGRRLGREGAWMQATLLVLGVWVWVWMGFVYSAINSLAGVSPKVAAEPFETHALAQQRVGDAGQASPLTAARFDQAVVMPAGRVGSDSTAALQLHGTGPVPHGRFGLRPAYASVGPALLVDAEPQTALRWRAPSSRAPPAWV